MIKKITLKNFLAHAETEIELGAGMTVLTGPNNSGKSSVVEALRCIATNPLPKHFIRHGAKVARVELEMDDGTRVVWVRKKATAWYEVFKPGAEEAEVYAKFGRKPPEDILNILRLNHVPLEGDKSLDVHIGNQRNPIFLLDQPASVAAQFFASSSEGSHLLAMQTELKGRVRTAKRDKKFQQQKMAQISDELDGLQDLPLVNLELESARELKGQADKLADEIPAIETFLRRKGELENTYSNLSAREKELAVLQPGPELFPTAPLEVAVSRMQSLRQKGESLKSRAASLEGLKPQPELYPVQRLEADIARQKQLSAADLFQDNRLNLLSPLCSPPELEDVATLSATISNVSRNRFLRDNISKRATLLAPLASPPELFEDSQLMQVVNNISSLKLSQDEMRKRLADLDLASERLKKRIGQRLAEIGNCPLCGGDLEADKLLGEAAYELS
ncbi:AAA family ATPase [Maridesulfovibrio hydrothermalis]|uniref:ATPase involved in DNA repair-like protein n=1 Tax=Maridesulfovibrio hydrothermalis AM13 = DSM 14728 TaxID=1121451 RepID=L0R9W4_9BACT|nr:AAA family ATPase [Maridesulfovibrio hydrothermalis]CCO22965.1 ATPase involved in DNA repair-like protein [Maridesulfovibrio hydrothermalis AM13 = DSM 14728]